MIEWEINCKTIMDTKDISTLPIIKHRIDWIDVAKGIAILLVIVGHSSVPILRGVIFSFHMPLFFILSCVTYKLSVNNNEFVEKTERAFIHLILPAIGIYFFRTVIKIVNDWVMLNTYVQKFDLLALRDYLANIINVFIVGSGVSVKIDCATIDALGIPWFLLVLFCGRTLFDYLQLKLEKKRFYIAIAICSIGGICFGKIQPLPLSFDIALSIQPLFLFSCFLRTYDIEKETLKKCIQYAILFVGGVCIIYLISHNYMELAVRRYPIYPFCFICAIAGTLFLSSFSQIILSLDRVSFPFKYIGKKTMKMLWVHCFDQYFSFAYLLTSNGYINALIRVVVDILVFVIVCEIISRFRNIMIKRKCYNSLR